MRDFEVRAILEGRKTQTRRTVKPQPRVVGDGVPYGGTEFIGLPECPYGQPGDRLWVRETWRVARNKNKELVFGYVADNSWSKERIVKLPNNWSGRDIPSIHMPRWASRLTLEIVSVRVERLNDISDEDAKDEGVIESYRPAIDPMGLANNYTVEFFKLWESINGLGSWDLNPWVWVVEFKEVKP